VIPKTLDNPFTRQQVGQELAPPPGSVPDLYAPVLDQCRTLAREVRKSGAGTSLIVRGEAGSGKSHLITQLRAETASDPGAFVIRVPMDRAYVGQVWRYVRAHVATEFLRKKWHPQQQDLTGLRRVVQNTFPEWSPDKAHGGLLGMFTGTTPAQALQKLLVDFAEETEVAYELRQVLPKVWEKDAAVAGLAGDWLRGKTLADDDLKKLGLPVAHPSEFEQEHTARDVVTSLCRLAGAGTTLVICFDEVEALLSGADDAATLRAFTTLVTYLVSEPGPRLVVTFIRPGTELTLRQHVEHSNLQKMGQVTAAVPPLAWEQVVRLVLARLHADPGCRTERAKHAADQFWPFAEGFLRDLYARHRLALTPRHVLIACRIEFDRLRKGGGRDEPTPPPPPPVATPQLLAAVVPPPPAAPGQALVAAPPASPAEPESGPEPVSGSVAPGAQLDPLFRRMWESRRTHHLSHLHALAFEKVVGDGLKWLGVATGAPYGVASAIDQRLGDVNLVFAPAVPGPKAIGVSFCHHDPQTLWRRLDRLTNQVQTAKAHGLLGRLMLVRAADAALSDKANERLDKIRRGGGFVLLLSKDQLAELATFQELMAKAQTGGLTDFGQPVPADRYTAWATANLSPGVTELAMAVFGDGIRRVAPAVGDPAEPKATAVIEPTARPNATAVVAPAMPDKSGSLGKRSQSSRQAKARK